MNVSLTPQLEALVRKKVESGMYGNASEVVREAIRQMDERDRGDTLQFNSTLVEEMKQDAARMALNGVQLDPDVCP